MLDVHVPEHRLSGVRDFLIHLLTITVGLLIALGLEAGVEAMHHRHQRQEAEELIRQELEANRADLEKAEADIKTETRNMVNVLTFLEAREQGQAGDAKDLNLGFHEGPLQDSAWRTANSTGVLTYIEYAKVQKFALAYKEQDLYETMQEKTLDEHLQLDAFVVRGFDPAKVTKEQATAALPTVRQALAHLQGMADVRRGALQVYADALK